MMDLFILGLMIGGFTGWMVANRIVATESKKDGCFLIGDHIFYVNRIENYNEDSLDPKLKT